MNYRLIPWALWLAFPIAHAQEKTLKEVTVTAESEAQSERKAAVTQKTVLDRAEIEALGGLTVGEVIRKLPGIDAVQGGDGGIAANARGMGRDAVQFLVDGERPTANARFALTAIGRLPAGEIERIEILRGASAEFGGSAPVSVNIIMRKARSDTKQSLKVALGQRGDEANAQLSWRLGGGDKTFSWLLPISVNRHALPTDKALTRQNATGGTRTLWQEESEEGAYKINELILSPRLTWRTGSSTLSLWPSLYHNEGKKESEFRRLAYANPVAGTGLGLDGSRRDQEDSRITILRVRAEGETRLSAGKLSGRVALMGAQRRADTDRRLTDAVGVVSLQGEQLRRNENEFSSALRWDQGIGEGLLSLGLEQARHERHDRQGLSGASAFSGSYRASSDQWTAWVQHEFNPAKSATLTSGLRAELIRLRSDGDTRQSTQLGPSLAARFEIQPDLIFRTSLGAGIKTPKLDEISALTARSVVVNSPLEPDRAGNPGLKAERNLNLELAIERHLGEGVGVIGANAYLRRTEDFIERRSEFTGGRWLSRPYNEGDARHWGLELDAKLRLDKLGFKGTSLRSHLTLPQARVADRRLGLTRDARDLPRYQWTLGIDQNLPAWQATAGMHLTRYGEIRTEVPGEQAGTQRPRSLLDAYIARKLTPSLNLRLDVQNILGVDIRRVSNAWSGANAWSLFGTERGYRTWLLSLEGNW